MTVTVGNVEFGNESLPVIAGPCVIESRDHCLSMAEKLKSVFSKVGIPFIFKSSFDKANRTSIHSFRGLKIDEGLKILDEVKKQFGIPVLTDIHLPEQALPVSEVTDIIQIPAFLCRQTDLLVAAGETGACVNIKKGQFVAPTDMKNIIEKIQSTGNRKILVTERGANFGYNNLVADMRSIPIMQEFGFPVIFDATHSVQRPSGLGNASGGDREMIPVLARAAVAAGCDGVFMEIHDNVENARSDAASQWPLQEAETLIKQLINIKLALNGV